MLIIAIASVKERGCCRRIVVDDRLRKGGQCVQTMAPQTDNTLGGACAMTMPDNPIVSFVMATHNRCDVVRHTLDRIGLCGLDRRDYEIVVVDNASTDGTPDAIGNRVDRLLRLSHNAGSCAKALGVNHAAGRLIVFLDDDSFPRPGSLRRMLEKFERDPHLGAAGFSVHLPDGRRESGALPDVFVGCGVGFRADALRRVGNLDLSFFMQAEEYDLTFRLAAAGWDVRVFDDLHVEHLKTAEARRTDRTTFLDVRNNLIVAARYLPRSYFRIYRQDWQQRYLWLAQRHHHEAPYRRGVIAGVCRGALDRIRYRGRRLSASQLERFFCWQEALRRMEGLRESGVRAVVFAGLGKNAYAFHRAARRAGVAVVAIGDDTFAADGRRYRGHSVLTLDAALQEKADAVVVSDMAESRASSLAQTVRAACELPVHAWYAVAPGSDRLRPTPLWAESGTSVSSRR